MLCFGIQLLDYSKLAVNSKNDNGFTISWYDIIVKFFDVVFFLIKFSYWSKFHVNVITGSGVMRYWPEFRKFEIPPSEFWPIYGNWDELGILNLAHMSLIKCYCMLENARITAFVVSELLRENHQGVDEGEREGSQTQIRANPFKLRI